MSQRSEAGIAIVGMACRFPGAADIETFWDNLRRGVESVTVFSPAELAAAGVAEATRADPAFVPAGGVVAHAEDFDAAFFDYSPREAALIDPQQRLLLECAVEALERAGCDPDTARGPIGVYAGMGTNTYLYNVVRPPELSTSPDVLPLIYSNGHDFLATRIAYKLNLTGPCLTVQSACSTSLLAIHLACQGLLAGECDVALAGGVSVRVPQRVGYLWRDGYPLSPDGHCRAFDAAARGTVFGNGAGLVVLKRLADARAAGDPLVALVRATAVNNDGSRKMGYTAPSVLAQAALIGEAHALAEVSADAVSYVEAHGTGTILGDPVEVAALTRAFRRTSPRVGFCALGSLKTNVGHMDAAAGVGSFIKTALALQHRELPASLNFTRANPELALESSPFYVNDRLRPWDTDALPRCAGVNSLGVGGTNVHAILEEAPPPEPSGPARPHQLLVLSAKSETALDTLSARLAARLTAEPALPLADVAFTLATGRRRLPFRRTLVCPDAGSAAALLTASAAPQLHARHDEQRGRGVAFLFPGGGGQLVRLGAALHRHEPVFRQTVDQCAAALQPALGLDLRQALWPRPDAEDWAAGQRERIRIQQCAVFVIEVALARLLESWGIRPTAMLGHSLGEFAAATLAGVFRLEDALQLVALRGALLESMPPGLSLSVALSEDDVAPLLGQSLSLAAVNAPALCVVSGAPAAVAAFEARLQTQNVESVRLHLTVAAHSSMTEPLIAPFAAALRRYPLKPPAIPYVSGATGDYVRPEEATDPDFWAFHLRRTVRFSAGLQQLLPDAEQVLLEVGPGVALSTLARRFPGAGARAPIVTALGHPRDPRPEDESLLDALGRLWAAGVAVDWPGYFGAERRRRVVLPTAPFERQRCMVEPRPREPQAPDNTRSNDPAAWFSVVAWQQEAPHVGCTHAERERWLLVAPEGPLGPALAAALGAAGDAVWSATFGPAFARPDERHFVIGPTVPDGYREILRTLAAADALPQHVVYLGGVTPPGARAAAAVAAATEAALLGLVALAQAYQQVAPEAAWTLHTVTSGVHDVLGAEPLCPEAAPLVAATRVIAQEHDPIRGRCIDLPDAAPDAALLARLCAELRCAAAPEVVALRGARRFSRTFRPLRLEAAGTPPPPIRAGGVYVVTGGLGGVGFALAEQLAASAPVKLALIARTPLPPRADFDAWLATHAPDDPQSERIQKVRRLEALGADVLPLAGDVADRARMTAVLAEVRARLGAPCGVIHAAGALSGALLAGQSHAVVARTLAPKVAGTLVLDELTAADPLDFFVLCSSLSAVLGPPGQVSYAAANAFLDAFAAARCRHGRPVRAIGWETWQDVGMAEIAARRGAAFAAAETQPAGSALRLRHPLVAAAYKDENDVTLVSSLTPNAHWVLDEHRLMGQAVMPATGWLELARLAAAEAEAAGDSPLVLEDVVFLAPLVASGAACRVHTEWRTPAAGAPATLRIRSFPDAAPPCEHVQARQRPGAAPERRRHDLAALAAACPEPVSLARLFASEVRGFGPRWRCLRAVQRGPAACLAHIELDPAFAADLADYALHPALLDAANPLLGAIAWPDHAEYVLFRMGRVTVHAPLPARFVSHARFVAPPEPGAASLRLDVTLCDEAGRELVVIEDYELRRVARDLWLAAPPPARPSPVEQAVRDYLTHNLRQGLKPAEGVEAFRRALGAGLPHLLVATRALGPRLAEGSLAALVRSVLSTKAPAAGPAAGPRRSGRLVLPRTPLETQLAAIWRAALGLAEIGIHDDFFELGGHSLMAAALVQEIRKQTGHEVPAAVLFERRTIATLAEKLAGAAGAAPFSPLLTLRAAGTKPGLTLIHPADGALFCFQQLLPRLDPERPIRGLQAFGQLAGQPPLDALPDIAARYLAALGPAAAAEPLVGFCMGGAIGFEMAQQRLADGKPPPLLVLIDTFAPYLFQGLGNPEDELALFLHFMRDFGGLSGIDILGRYVERRGLNQADGPRAVRDDLQTLTPDERLEHLWASSRGPDRFADREDGVAHMGRVYGIYRGLFVAGQRYVMRPYPGRVVLLRAASQVSERNDTMAAWQRDDATLGALAALGADPTLGWGRYCADLEVHNLPGNHFSMLRPPHVDTLAARLADALR